MPIAGVVGKRCPQAQGPHPLQHIQCICPQVRRHTSHRVGLAQGFVLALTECVEGQQLDGLDGSLPSDLSNARLASHHIQLADEVGEPSELAVGVGLSLEQHPSQHDRNPRVVPDDVPPEGPHIFSETLADNAGVQVVVHGLDAQEHAVGVRQDCVPMLGPAVARCVQHCGQLQGVGTAEDRPAEVGLRERLSARQRDASEGRTQEGPIVREHALHIAVRKRQLRVFRRSPDEGQALGIRAEGAPLRASLEEEHHADAWAICG
mmetsp:Transcript_10148/g.31624  ORF Transcript_10148/g.31624 Transcript_10148/m.31624 type:complete len:263 (+) Transcript_10148:140-928(+)